MYFVRDYSIFHIGEIQSDLQDMAFPNYPRLAFGLSVLGSSFWLKREPGYHIGRASSLGLESGPVSPFLQPYQLPPSPCIRSAWARAEILVASAAVSMCPGGLVKAYSPPYVL